MRRIFLGKVDFDGKLTVVETTDFMTAEGKQ